MITAEERAEELYGVVRACTLCALARSRTHAVPGEGPLDAEVMCIGEAPGVNEDKQGRPFVGAAGQFLAELLAAGGLTREQVYICNVLKCRPPGNRDPMPGEIEACSEYLDLQLDLVDPLVVVTLGRFSMSKWFPQQAISRIHGTVREVDGRFVVPMYHPAAALHQGNLRQVLLNDFARLPSILERARQGRGRPAEHQENGALLASPPPPATRGRGGGPGGEEPERDESIERVVSSQAEPPWAEPAFGEDEVEFDPGDHVPVRPAATPAEPAPAPEGQSLHSGDEGPPPPHITEPTAEQGTDPAVKSQQQLSLFD